MGKNIFAVIVAVIFAAIILNSGPSAFADDDSYYTNPGSYVGIGVAFCVKDKKLVVSDVMGPAKKAGLKEGDIIISIDRTETEGMSPEEAVRLMRGEKGTKVILRIKSGWTTKTVTIVRDYARP